MKKTRSGKIKVLVTGVGGNIGQGIVKALRMSRLDLHIIGTDMNPLSAGFYFCDEGYVVRSSQNPLFLPQVLQIIKQNKIRLLLVGSEPEIIFFAKHREKIQSDCGCFVLVSDPETSLIGYDKWRTYLFCKEKGIAYPETILPDSTEQIDSFLSLHPYPVIVKGRTGYGSKDVWACYNRDEVEVFLKRAPNPVLQEFIGSDSEEYTASSFVAGDQTVIGTILFRRLLQSGTTYKAEVVSRHQKLVRAVESIVKILKPLGPCNIQFRLVSGRVVPFEFNIRFSGTVPIRSFLGFNDVEMAVQEFVLKKKPKVPRIQQAVSFRYWNELWVLRENFKKLGRRKHFGGNQKCIKILDELAHRKPLTASVSP